MAVLILENLTISTFERTILENVNLSFEEGKSYLILGQSGEGKTTLLKAIAGLLDENYKISGNIIIPDSENQNGGKSIFIALQDQYGSFSPVRRLEKELMLSLRLQKIKSTRKERKSLIEKSALLSGLDREDLRKYPHELSGGMLERAQIAKAYLSESRILLFDESTSSLDIDSELKAFLEIGKIAKERKGTALFVTHSRRLSDKGSTHTVLLKEGHAFMED